MTHPVTPAAISGSKRKTTTERLAKAAQLARLAQEGHTVHDIVVTTGLMGLAAQREIYRAKRAERKPDVIEAEIRFLDHQIQLANENRAALEQHGRPMWLPAHGGEFGQQLLAADLWRKLNAPAQRQHQLQAGTIHPWIREGDDALQRAQEARRRYPDITRFLTGRSHPPIPPYEVNQLGLRRALVQAAIWYLQETKDQQREKRQHRRNVQDALAALEEAEDRRRIGRMPGLEQPAPVEAHAAYPVKEYQEGIEVALGEFEKGDLTRGDHAALLSREAMGRRFVDAIKPLQDTDVVGLFLLVKHDADGRIHVHARFKGQEVILPDAIRHALAEDARAHQLVQEIWEQVQQQTTPAKEQSVAAISAAHDALEQVRHQRALARQVLVEQLQQFMEYWAPFALALSVTLRGNPWHETQFMVYNHLMGQDACLVKLSVLQHPHQKWEVKASINGVEVKPPAPLTVDAVGAARYPDNGYLPHLLRALCTLRHQHARGSRVLMVFVRGPMMTWEGSRKRYRFCQGWLGLLDPMGKKSRVEYVLFDGAPVSIPNVIRSAEAYRKGIVDRSYRDLLSDRPLFDVGEVETKRDAVQAVIRYMYHRLPVEFRMLRKHPRTDELEALVPPEDWDLFQANLDALWDSSVGKPIWDFDARDFQRPHRVEPYVAFTEDFSATVEIEIEA